MSRIASARPAALLLTVLLATGCTSPPPVPETPSAAGITDDRLPDTWRLGRSGPIATSTGGMVASDAPLATRVGVEMLESGGNAVDAAAATALALAVVYPEAGNLGGGGFLVYRSSAGETASLDFREMAPAAATRNMYLDPAGQMTDRSVVGYLASGVPGAVAGIYEAHRKYGSRPWAEVVAPAIRLAREGFTVDENLESSIRGDSAMLSQFAGSRALYLPEGRPLRAGSVWRNPDLAAVLERIAARGAEGFYRGETADLIVAEMKRGGGIITHQDLASYQAKWREPVVFDYRGHSVVSMPPPSSGGLTLALIANILEGYDMRAAGWHSPRAVHLTAEAMRRAFADRNHYLGDPDFVTIPRAQFLSDDYAARLRASIDENRATPSTQVRAGAVARTESDHTTHFSVVDAEGNAVALTTTVNSLYGSGVTVSGAGFVLNNEMDDFTSKPGEPNQFGLVQGEANAIQPGKRMLSAMTPTIVSDPQGRVLLVTGARGGPRIITAVAQVLLNVVDYGFPVDAAVRLPRLHHQHLPDILFVENGGYTDAQLAALRAMGHDVQTGSTGVAPSILRADGRWTGTGDPRRHGSAEGTR